MASSSRQDGLSRNSWINSDTYLRLENAEKKVLEETDDIRDNNRDSRLVFPHAENGVYRLVATSYQQRGVGAYTITIREFERKK